MPKYVILGPFGESLVDVPYDEQTYGQMIEGQGVLLVGPLERVGYHPLSTEAIMQLQQRPTGRLTPEEMQALLPRLRGDPMTPGVPGGPVDMPHPVQPAPAPAWQVHQGELDGILKLLTFGTLATQVLRWLGGK